uniref:Protein kinase domain-containing protein n=1 Tax=Plectus sambesii TaxID=2011161 RepID=A0A914W8R5_9BILA
MNNEYSEYSAESENEEDCINPNEMLLVDNPEYMNCDVLIQEGYDYKAIRAKYEIEPDTLTIIKAIGKGYFSDVHVGMLSMPTQSIAVAVKTSQMKTGAMNAEESEDILRRQRQALKDELSIFAHLQSSSVGGHENVLKLLGAITTVKTSFCILTEYCECGSLDSFLQAKWKNGAFEDELVFDANENEKVWKNQRDSNWADSYQSRRDQGLVTTSDLMCRTFVVWSPSFLPRLCPTADKEPSLEIVAIRSEATALISSM